MGDGRIPFQPSNSDHGLAFMSEWCDRCRKDAARRRSDDRPGCMILAMTMCYSSDDPEYPPQWRQDGPEGPRCTAFVEDMPRQRKSRRKADISSYNRRNAIGELFE